MSAEPSRLARWLERIALGALMTFLAWLLDRRLRRALRNRR